MIRSAAALVGWDQETNLPPAGARLRAEQLSWLSARAHEAGVSAEWGRMLGEAGASDDGADAVRTADLRELRRRYERARKIPVELVARESAATSLAKHAWADARARSDFATFAPHLETLLGIAREKAELWGYEGEPYDALLENYERGTRTAMVAEQFESVRGALAELAAAAVERSQSRTVALPSGPYPVAGQQRLNSRIAAEIGFDFQAGRIDTSTHPFCSRIGPGDVRMTTRYDENDFTSSLFGVLHESGHGLYEQGLPEEAFGLPSGGSVSLGIHESQSRLFENHVGRSRGFWERWYPVAVETFPQLGGFPLDDFLAHVQRARFSPIRVEADEATYDLHILLRFDLERRMLRGEIPVAEVPAAWNESFRALFGFAPENDRSGCLQDIHWSMGGLGYFATYTLGNFNAAQLFAAATRDPQVAAATAAADYRPLLGWMRREIHVHGGVYDPPELMRRATGVGPSADAYLDHLRRRYVS